MMRLITGFSIFLATACGDSDKTIRVENAVPDAAILSHAEGTTIGEGVPTTFIGSAVDEDHGPDELTATWYVDGEEVCSDQTPDEEDSIICEITLTGESATVRLEVKDPLGAAGTDEVNLVVTPTDAPEVEITSPAENDEYSEDELITFSGVIGDTEDDAADLTSVWTATQEGEDPIELELDTTPTTDGAISDTTSLDVGDWGITLHVTDSDGKTNQASVTIKVTEANVAPTCEITAPEDDAVGVVDDLVNFEAIADDDGPLDSLSATWSSDIDDALATSTVTSDGEINFSTSELSPGTHTITLSVADADGATCSDTMTYTVGTPPQIIIDSPTEDGTYYVDGLIEFSGTVSDGEDAAEDLIIVWVSSEDGELTDVDATPDTDGDFSGFGNLTVGSHGLEVTVTDLDGLTASETVIIEVNPENSAPSCNLSAPATAEPTDAIELTGTATDADEPHEGLSAVITDETGAVIAEPTPDAADGSFTESVTLGEGSHTLTLTVTDEAGASCTSSATIEVEASNTAPTCSIDTPLAGDPPFDTDVAAEFTATVGDTEDAATDLTISWTTVFGGGAGSSTADASGATTYAIGGLPTGTHTMTMTVTDTGGLTCEDTREFEVGVPPEVAITAPADGSVHNDDAAISFTGTASDARTLSPLLAISWVSDRDGVINTDAADITGAVAFDHSGLTMGTHVITLTAIDTDGLTASDSRTITVNYLPSAPEVQILPDPAETTDDLVATIISDGVDPEGTTVTYTYAWTRNGSPTVHASNTVAAADTLEGETWEVTVTSWDADGFAGASSDDDIEIQNALPVISSVTLTAPPVYTNDTITATVTGSDADVGDTVTYTYEWDVSGLKIDTGTDNTLDGTTHFGKHDTVWVRVTPNDGDTDGAYVDSGEIVISNSLPTAPTVVITAVGSATSVDEPGPTESLHDLFCEKTADGTDDDGDPINYTVSWSVDSATAFTPTTTTWPDDTLPGDTPTVVGENWTCTMTAEDEDDVGAAGTASVEIGLRCDWDSDGYSSADIVGCGGDDCNDDDADINPDATEIWYDGVDQDCDEADDYDADGDGERHMDHGGEDCADEDPTRIDCSDGTAEYLEYGGAPENVAWHSMETDTSNDRLIVYGGQSYYTLIGAGATSDTQIYAANLATLADSSVESWSVIETAGVGPGARMGHASTMDDDSAYMYIYGGQTYYTLSDELFRLDTTTNTWSTVDVAGDGPGPLVGGSMEISGDYLFVFGGQTYYGLNDAVYMTNLGAATPTWSTVTGGDSVQGVEMASAMDEFGRIWVFGGQGYHKLNNSAWCIDTAIPSVSALDMTGDEIPAATGMASTWASGAGGAILYGGQSYYQLLEDAWWVRPTDGEICSVVIDKLDLGEGGDIPAPLVGAALSWSEDDFRGYLMGGQSYYTLSKELHSIDP